MWTEHILGLRLCGRRLEEHNYQVWNGTDPMIKNNVHNIVKTCDMAIITKITHHIALFWSKQVCSEWRNGHTPDTQPWWQINGTLPPLHAMYVYYTFPLHVMCVNVHAIYTCGFTWLAPVRVEAFITTVRLLIRSALETPEQAKFTNFTDDSVLCIFHVNLNTIGFPCTRHS